jgi:MazG family protein
MSDSPEPSSGTGASSRTGSADPAREFERLVQLMATLRAPGGCPWDREQTFDTIKPFTLEETYEVMDSIDARDWPALAEELGDLMLQCVFYAQMAAEQNLFTISDSLRAINDKLVRRHPHVFGSDSLETADAVKQRWDQIKAEEKRKQGREAAALLDGVPRSQPALAEAQQISAKVAKVGFDWPDVSQVIAKLHEELAEIDEARAAAPEKLEEEIGDLLFVVVNLARHSKVDAEQALRLANRKFRRRFAHVESGLRSQGIPLGEATLDQMEALWQEAKRAR